MINTCKTKNTAEILKHLKELIIDNTKPIILLDADRTLCDQDTGRTVFDYLNLDWSTIKKGFKQHGYVYTGFKTMCDVLSTSPKQDYLNSCNKTAANMELYPGAVEFLSNISKQVNTIILTAGCGPIWEEILDLNGVENVTVISGGHSSCDDFLIGREEKGFIASYFKTLTSHSVIAIGDSDVDTLMLLRSDIRGLVVNHKNNGDIINNLGTENIDFQLSFCDFKHEEIKQTSYFDLKQLVIGE